MYGYDFIFRDEKLSSHGYMVCDFDDASSANTATTDSQRDFTSISMFGSKYFPILYYTYNSQLVMEFSICKIGDKNNKNLISPTECAVIKRWLDLQMHLSCGYVVMNMMVTFGMVHLI